MTHLIKLYKPFVGTESKFTDALEESTKEAGEIYWRNLDKSCLAFLLLMLVVSIGICICYFTIYNKYPGRHYRLTHWGGFYILSALTAFLGTWGLGWLLAKPTVQGAGWLLLDISLGNLCYTIIIYGILSVIWWLFLPTNAYRPIKKRI